MIANRRDGSREWTAHRGLIIGAAGAVLLVMALAASLWTVLATSSGALVLAWCAAWSLGAGIAGWQARSWLWPGLGPAAMLLLALLWSATVSQSSWTSAIVTFLGAMFAVAAAIGAVLGTWLGKRQSLPERRPHS